MDADQDETKVKSSEDSQLGTPTGPPPPQGRLLTTLHGSSTHHGGGDHVMIPDLAGLTEDSPQNIVSSSSFRDKRQFSMNSDESSEDESDTAGAATNYGRRRSLAASSLSSPPSSPEQEIATNTTQSGRNQDERVKRRREKNKMAAQRCRQRRRDHVDILVRETQKLECDNTSLAYQIRQLEKERNRLQFTLVQHQLSCTQRGTPQFRWVQDSLASQNAAATNAGATATATATAASSVHQHHHPSLMSPMVQSSGFMGHSSSAVLSSPHQSSTTSPPHQSPSPPASSRSPQ